MMARIRALLALCACFAMLQAAAREPASKPAELRFGETSQELEFERLLPHPAFAVTAGPGYFAVSNGDRAWLVRQGRKPADLARLLALDGAPVWFGALCALERQLLTSVSSSTREALQAELTKPRGAFRSGPAPAGFAILDTGRTSGRVVPGLAVAGQPGPLAVHFQSCARDGGRLLVGAYGYLLRVDAGGNAEIVVEDEAMEFSRTAILPEAGAVWVNEDEGGVAGEALVRLPRQSGAKASHYRIDLGEDVAETTAISRHRGRLWVATHKGLFVLDDASGRITRIVLGNRRPDAAVLALRSGGGYLWAGDGDSLLRIDTRGQQVVRYTAAAGRAPRPVDIAPSGRHWLVAGPDGVWRTAPK